MPRHRSKGLDGKDTNDSRWAHRAGRRAEKPEIGGAPRRDPRHSRGARAWGSVGKRGISCARERQSFVEGRVKEIESLLSRAEVIDPSKFTGTVKFGATVTLVDSDTDEERTYQIVGEAEADIERSLLNIRSPLARALIGKDVGDTAEVRTPGGEKSYEILNIRYA